MFYSQKKFLFLSLMMVMLIVLPACGAELADGEPEKNTERVVEEQTSGAGKDATEVASEKELTKAYTPFSIQNYHRLVTFTEKPKRAVSLNGHTTEMMIELGLKDVMVGTAYQSEDILPKYVAAYNKIPILAEKYPSVEVLLAAEPDFVFSRESAINGKSAIGSVTDLESYGIKSYVSKGTYILGARMDDVYEDILNLGRIFQIEDRANELVISMQNDIKKIQDKIGKVEEPKRVVVMDSGGDTLFTAAQSLQTTLIKMAGGKNVFDDIAKTWATVSWEEMVARDPEVIVINEYGDTPSEDKIKEMMDNPALKNVTAIKNKRFVILSLASVFEGVRNVEALDILAKGFYPEKFSN
jgi:iron complex transport system substrate-binding protein